MIVSYKAKHYGCTTLSTRGMETAIRTQKETIIELEARIQANTEEIGKVHIIRWSILAGRVIASSLGAGYQAS